MARRRSFALCNYDPYGVQQLDEDEDQDHPLEDCERRSQGALLANSQKIRPRRDEQHPNRREQNDILPVVQAPNQPRPLLGHLTHFLSYLFRQCKKWRRLVMTIATLCRSAAPITSASRLEPPGWMSTFTPASARTSRPSANGKKASLAATVPSALSPAFLTASCAASTRLVWPVPTPTVASSLANTMALLLTPFATLQAKSRSPISDFKGRLSVTNSYPESSSTRSVCCSRRPPVTGLAENSGGARGPASRWMMFGFAENTSRASTSKPGATSTSVKTLEISPASSPLTGSFSATMPPKAETGSDSKALWYASRIFSPIAAPHGLACLTMTTAGPPPSERSASMVRAASTS